MCLSVVASVCFAAPGDVRWSTFLGGNIGSSPAVSSLTGRIFVGSADSHLYALMPSGDIVWRFNAGGAIGSTPALNEAQQTVFVATLNGAVLAVDVATGVQRWRYSTGSSIYSSPAVASDGMVVVGADNGYVYALNGTTGTLIWSFNVGSAVGASPAIGADGLIYVGTRNGILQALESTGTTVRTAWSTQLTGGVASATLSENQLFVGTFGNYLYGFDLQEGVAPVLRWTLPLAGRVASSPVLSGNGTLYVTTYDDGSLHGVDPATGAIAWTFDAAGMVYGSAAVGSNGRVYFGDGLGNVYAINPAAYATAGGNPLVWSKRADSGFYASPAIVNGSVLLNSNRSVMYAYEDNVTGLNTVSAWPAFGRSNRREAAFARVTPVYDVAVSLVGKNGKFDSSTQQVRFDVVVENLGTAPLSNVSLALTYPYAAIDSLALVSITNPNGSCDASGETCVVDYLEAESSAVINVVMSQAAKLKGTYEVNVAVAEPEQSVANNVATKVFGGSLGYGMLIVLGLFVWLKRRFAHRSGTGCLCLPRSAR